MTRKQLIEAIANCADISQAAAGRVLDCLEEAVMKGVDEDGKVATGLGSFVLRERAAREGRNPATGERIHIPASRSVGLKPSKAFKDYLS